MGKSFWCRCKTQVLSISVEFENLFFKVLNIMIAFEWNAFAILLLLVCKHDTFFFSDDLQI